MKSKKEIGSLSSAPALPEPQTPAQKDSREAYGMFCAKEIERINGAGVVGIMGGTFDPIHFGHLAIAETARTELGLDLVLLMPAGNPSFKCDKDVTDKEHRYKMTAAAAASNDYFLVSDAELKNPGITYTVDTVRALRKACRPDLRLYFITGADTFINVFKWKDADELFGLTDFAVASRPGSNKKKLQTAVNTAIIRYGKDVPLLNAVKMDISSSDIRERFAKGLSVRYLLPDPVLNYINENNLYVTENVCEDIIRRVKAVQSDKRFAHTLSVAAEARRLALIHGADAGKAHVSGLLHDVAKGLPDAKILERIKLYKLDVDDITTRKISLAHAAVGAEIAAAEYGINDPCVLDAIRYHTTGRPCMGILEKIVFVADFIEPTRSFHSDIAHIKTLADTDLDAAVMAILRDKIDYNRSLELHPLSQQALDYYTRQYEKREI